MSSGPPNLNLFSFLDQRAEHGKARHTDPETSHEAAKSVDANRLEQMVLAELRQHPEGLNTQEIAENLNLSLITVSPRMKPLERKGLVRRGPAERRGDRKAIIWFAS